MSQSPPQPPPAKPAGPTPLDPDLLNLLRCPLTRSPLRLEGDHLVATVGGLRYPVRDGIPVMLIEEALLPEGVPTLDDLKRRLATPPPKPPDPHRIPDRDEPRIDRYAPPQ